MCEQRVQKQCHLKCLRYGTECARVFRLTLVSSKWIYDAVVVFPQTQFMTVDKVLLSTGS